MAVCWGCLMNIFYSIPHCCGTQIIVETGQTLTYVGYHLPSTKAYTEGYTENSKTLPNPSGVSTLTLICIPKMKCLQCWPYHCWSNKHIQLICFSDAAVNSYYSKRLQKIAYTKKSYVSQSKQEKNILSQKELVKRPIKSHPWVPTDILLVWSSDQLRHCRETIPVPRLLFGLLLNHCRTS